MEYQDRSSSRRAVFKLGSVAMLAGTDALVSANTGAELNRGVVEAHLAPDVTWWN